jgi:hypothetical protein
MSLCENSNTAIFHHLADLAVSLASIVDDEDDGLSLVVAISGYDNE